LLNQHEHVQSLVFLIIKHSLRLGILRRTSSNGSNGAINVVSKMRQSKVKN